MTFLESATTSIKNTADFFYNNTSKIILTTGIIVGYIALTQIYSSILATQVLIIAYQFAVNYIDFTKNHADEHDANIPKLLKNNVSIGILSIILSLIAPMYNALRYIRFIVMMTYAAVLAQQKHTSKDKYAENTAYQFVIIPTGFNWETKSISGITLGNILDTISNTFPVMKMMDVIDAIALILAAMSLVPVLNFISSAFYSLILSQLFINVLLLTILPALVLGPHHVRPVITNIMAFCTSCMTYIRSLFTKPSTDNTNTSQAQALIAPVAASEAHNDQSLTPSLTSVVSSDLIIITRNILSAPLHMFSKKEDSVESNNRDDAMPYVDPRTQLSSSL